MQLGPQLEDLVRKHGSARLRKIDIGDWDSAVAKENGIRSLPTLVLYEGRERVSADTRQVLRRLQN